ncbi:MAG: nuclear transport factor 2 family protein [Steroidobacteraceae bacterium]
MSKAPVNRESEQAISDIQSEMKRAWAARDANRICAIYQGIGEDFLLFDLYQPFEDVGMKRAVEKTENFLELTEGPVFVEYGDQRMFSSADLVVVRSRCQFNFTMKGQTKKTEILCRSTMVFQLIQGVWTCVHQHDSLPNKDVDI